MKKTMISARVDQYHINEILKLQQKTNLSLSDIIRRALTKLLREEYKKEKDNQWFTS